MDKLQTIKLDDVEYVRLDSIKSTPATNPEGLPYVVIRSRDSGCHAGFLKEEEGNNLTLVESIRLWFWSGAATLSQLAEEGVTKPEDCKFGMPVSEITVYGCCEKIQATTKARKSITGVKSWKK